MSTEKYLRKTGLFYLAWPVLQLKTGYQVFNYKSVNAAKFQPNKIIFLDLKRFTIEIFLFYIYIFIIYGLKLYFTC